MAFLSKKQVKQLLSLSFATIDRLEAAGKFPRRFKLTDARVAWDEEELKQWMLERLSQREHRPAP